MSKKITGFNVERSPNSVTRSSVFERLVKEVEPTAIPGRYIQTILVKYKDGSSIELKGDEISHPLPVSKDTAKALLDESLKQVSEVKLFLHLDQLEADVNKMVEDVLGRHC